MEPDGKPKSQLRCVLATEEVEILSDKKIKGLTQENLTILIDYYKTTLEVLAGTQVWDILDSLKAAELENHIRKNKSLKRVI